MGSPTLRRSARGSAAAAALSVIAALGIAAAPTASATNLTVPSHYCTAPSAITMALAIGDTLTLNALGACNQLTWPEKNMTAAVNGATVTGGTAPSVAGASIVLTATAAGADVVRLSNNGADVMTINVLVVAAPGGHAGSDAASTTFSLTRDNSGVMCSQATGVSGFLLANCLTVVIDMFNDGSDGVVAGANDRLSAQKKRKVMTVRIDANAVVVNDLHIDPQASRDLQQGTLTSVAAGLGKLVDALTKSSRTTSATG